MMTQPIDIHCGETHLLHNASGERGVVLDVAVEKFSWAFLVMLVGEQRTGALARSLRSWHHDEVQIEPKIEPSVAGTSAPMPNGWVDPQPNATPISEDEVTP